MVDEINFVEVFCAEARTRLETARTAFDEGSGLARYDQIHQEFDTLAGAARACNLPDWEHWCRLLARFARHLRRQLASGVDTAAHALLQEAIDHLEAADSDAQRSGITPAALVGPELQSLERTILFTLEPSRSVLPESGCRDLL